MKIKALCACAAVLTACAGSALAAPKESVASKIAQEQAVAFKTMGKLPIADGIALTSIQAQGPKVTYTISVEGSLAGKPGAESAIRKSFLSGACSTAMERNSLAAGLVKTVIFTGTDAKEARIDFSAKDCGVKPGRYEQVSPAELSSIIGVISKGLPVRVGPGLTFESVASSGTSYTGTFKLDAPADRKLSENLPDVLRLSACRSSSLDMLLLGGVKVSFAVVNPDGSEAANVELDNSFCVR